MTRYSVLLIVSDLNIPCITAVSPVTRLAMATCGKQSREKINVLLDGVTAEGEQTSHGKPEKPQKICRKLEKTFGWKLENAMFESQKPGKKYGKRKIKF